MVTSTPKDFHALANSQPGAQVAQHAPVPRWGWGVAPPYRPGA